MAVTCLPYVINPFVDPIGEVTTGANYNATYQDIIQHFGTTAKSLMVPNNMMVIQSGALDGIQAGIDRMRKMLEIRDEVLPQLEGGLTGTNHGRKSAILATVLTGVLMLAPFGIDIYQLVDLAKKDGIKAAAGSQLGIQVITEAALIVAATLWMLHRMALQLKTKLAAVTQELYDNALAMQDWTQKAHNLDQAVKKSDDNDQVTAFRQTYSAWLNLPARNKKEINIDLFIEQHLHNLQDDMPLKARYNRMRALALQLYNMRVDFLNLHPEAVIAGHANVEFILTKISADGYGDQVDVWKALHKDLAVEWLELQAKIGPFKEFDLPASAPPGWRCTWPGAVYHADEPRLQQLQDDVNVLNQSQNGEGGIEIEMGEPA